jgi:flagellar assembly factor FliW
MPKLATLYFGELDYTDESVYCFPAGIPGFENQTAFVFLDQPQTHPMVFIQSLQDPGLCFISVPIFAIDPEYRLNLGPDERAALQLPAGETPQISEQLICLGLVIVEEGTEPTANLMSPIVVNLRTRVGIQALQSGSISDLRRPLLSQAEVVPCS